MGCGCGGGAKASPAAVANRQPVSTTDSPIGKFKVVSPKNGMTYLYTNEPQAAQAAARWGVTYEATVPVE